MFVLVFVFVLMFVFVFAGHNLDIIRCLLVPDNPDEMKALLKELMCVPRLVLTVLHVV